MNIKWRPYRLIMKIAHKYHWHYAPPIYPEGDTQLWCKWCGFRQTIKIRDRQPIGEPPVPAAAQKRKQAQ